MNTNRFSNKTSETIHMVDVRRSEIYPKISVAVISYNNAKYIIQTIESVLAQTLFPYEIIIQDDCSNDSSWKIIQSFADKHPNIIKIFRHKENKGIAANFNSAIERCTGELLTWVAGDDRFLPEKLAFEWYSLNSNPICRIAYSNVYMTDETGRCTGIWDDGSKPAPPSGNIFNQVFAKRLFKGRRSLYRNPLLYRSVIDSVGLFDESLDLFEDYDWKIRAAHQFHAVYTGKPLVEYRIHPDGAHNSSPSKLYSAISKVLKKNFGLLRQNPPDVSKAIEEDIYAHAEQYKRAMKANRKKANVSYDRHNHLVFLISLPRSGSTLLQRIIGGHDQVFTAGETWLMLHPLYALKHDRIQTDYESQYAETGLRELLNLYPEKDEIFFDAVRRYSLTFYDRALRNSGKIIFLDKTPRYYMILQELYRVFPDAHYVFLFRNPMAVLSSMLKTWFGNIPEKLLSSRNYQDLINAPKCILDAIEVMGQRATTLHYEQLVGSPANTIRQLCARLGITYHDDMLLYGRKQFIQSRLGDPVGVHKYDRPVTDNLDRWIDNLTASPRKEVAHRVLEDIGSDIITRMGYDADSIVQALEGRHPNKNMDIAQTGLRRPSECPDIKDAPKPFPIVICQMGKVGSTSLTNSLAKMGIENRQIHFLSSGSIDRIEAYYRGINPTAIPDHLRRSREINEMMTRIPSGMKWKLISLVRDPVARAISSVFQNMHDLFPGIDQLNDEDAFVRIRAYLQDQLSRFDEISDYACTWFDNEIKTVLGFDIFQHQFDKKRGYGIFRTESVDFLIIRTENLTACCQAALKDFMGVESFELSNDNMAQQKPYHHIYKRLLHEITFPEPVLDRIYGSRFSRHFFTNSEINAYKQRFRDNPQSLSSCHLPLTAGTRQEYPKISIVTPSFNQAKFLEACIRSILDQGYPNLEYIIMDGGSTDGSVGIIEKYASNLHYWQSQPDGGHYAAVNQGFSRSSGEIMAWLNSDDLLHQDSLFKVAYLFHMNPHAEWLLGRYTTWDENGVPTKKEKGLKLWERKHILEGDYKWIQQESSFWKRSLWDRAGGRIDPAYDLAGDLDLWCRFFRHAPVFRTDALLGGYRLHGNQRAQLQMTRYIHQAEMVIAKERELAAADADQRLIPAPGPLRLDPDGWQNFTCAPANGKKASDATAPVMNKQTVDPLAIQAYQQTQNLVTADRIAEAEAALLEIVSEFPDFALAHNDLGVLHYRTGRKDRALAFYQAAVARDPGNGCFLKNLADFCCYESRDFEAAVELYERVLTVDPGDCEAQISLANAFIALGQEDKARLLCRQVHAMDPGNTAAAAVLSGLDNHCPSISDATAVESLAHQRAGDLLTAGCMEEALQSYMAILQDDPADTEALLSIARISEHFGKVDDAKGFYRMVLQIDPHHPTAGNRLKNIRFEERTAFDKNRSTITLPNASAHGMPHGNKVEGISSDSTGLPRITLVTPNLNQGRFLSRCISSVLDQNYPDLEYWIVDGGSTDGSQDIIGRFASQLAGWISEKDSGQSEAVNKGLSKATGRIFAWLNADDYLEPGALAQVAGSYRSNPSASAWVGACRRMDPDGRCLNIVFPNNLERNNLGLNYNGRQFYQPACFFNTYLLTMLGGLDESLHFAMDFDLYLRLMTQAPFVAGPGIWANALIHADAKTQHSRAAMFTEIHHIQKREGFFEGAEQTYQKCHFNGGRRFLRPWASNAVDENGNLKGDGIFGLSPPPSKRRDICFVGCLSDPCDRNDLQAFLRDVFPILRQHDADLQLHVYGNGVPALSPEFEFDAVRFFERPRHLAPILADYRVMVYPLTTVSSRAEILTEAAVQGLPVVTTPAGVVRLPFIDGKNCFVADNPEIFAYKCLQLLQDPICWENFRHKASMDLTVSERPMPEAETIQTDHNPAGIEMPLDRPTAEQPLSYSDYPMLRNELASLPTARAIAGLSSFIEQNPAHAAAHNEMGGLLIRAGRPVEALACYQCAVELAPRDITLRKNLADYLFTVHDRIEDALPHYLAILEQCPTNVETLLALGQLCERLGKVADAMDFYCQVLAIDPDNAWAQAGIAAAKQLPATGPDRSEGKAGMRMVVVSQYLPRFDRGSADYRNHHILDQLARDGWHVLYLYTSEVDDDSRYTDGFADRIAFQRLPWNTAVFRRVMASFAPDVAWITSLWTIPYVEFILDLIQAGQTPTKFRIVIDTMDFHAKKFERKYAASGIPDDLAKAERFRTLEKTVYPLADRIVTVTEAEAEDIRAAVPNCASLGVVPNVHDIPEMPAPPEGRRHICFLGNFTVNHNVDAAQYFIADILPLIRDRRPQTEFHLIGYGSDKLANLSVHPGVRVIGQVADLIPVLDRYRVFACPMTYGAGMKGKIGMALANGLPIVSTSIGLEGFPVQDGRHCFATDEAGAFAAKCLVLLENDDLWNTFQREGRKLMREHYSRVILSDRLQGVLSFDSPSSMLPSIGTCCADPMPIERTPDNLLASSRKLDDIRSATCVRAGARHLFASSNLHVSWILTRRCNYDCTYCNAHDNLHGKFPSLENLKTAVDKIAEIKDRPIYFGLAGGEPTIHPHYVELLGYLCERLGDKLQSINTTTNLSLPPAFFSSMKNRLGHDLRKIQFVASYHFEFAREEKFIRNARYLAECGIPLTISVMAHPEQMRAVKLLWAALHTIDSNLVRVRVVPIRENFGVVLDQRYSTEDIAWLRQCDAHGTNEDILLDVSIDGALHRLSLPHATDLTSLGLNRFKGMHCNAGFNHISIDEDGDIAPAVCFRNRHKEDGNIYTEAFVFQPKPVVCPFERCGCTTDLRIPKYLPGFDNLSFNQLPLSGGSKSTAQPKVITINARQSDMMNSDEVLERYQAFMETLSSENPTDLASQLESFVERYPGCAAAHNDLAVISMNLGSREDARRHFTCALDLEPGNATFLKNEADFRYFFDKNPEAARKTYLDLVQRFPEDTEVLFALARIHQDAGQFDEARGYLERILKRNPTHADALATLHMLPAPAVAESPADQPPSGPLRRQKTVGILEERLRQRKWQNKASVYTPCIERIEHLRRVPDPAISIITISWRLDPDTIETFRRLESERHLGFELIFVDNGGQPGEFDGLKPHVDTYIRLNRNTGAYLARNMGALLANAAILLFLEDDGLPAPHFVESHLEAFRRYEVLSVRGVYQPKNPANHLNALAPHYYLGDKPFPHFVNLEGNASYRSTVFFSVGGWDDQIHFGHGGPELAYRLYQHDPDFAKQIYSPAPILYHDFADTGHHLQSKFEKQSRSMDRLVSKYPDFENFLQSWSDLYRRTDILKGRSDQVNTVSTNEMRSRPNQAKRGKRPRISVVIPTFNRAAFLQEALASALEQTLPADEILVIDDASTDRTGQVVDRMADASVRCIRKEHSGAPHTRNRGIAEATGDYILWLDDDDILMPDALESHLAVLNADPEVDVVYGVLQEFDSITGVNLKRIDPKDWAAFPNMMIAAMMAGCAVPNPGTMVRRSVYERLGGYDLSFSRAQDYEFWSRALTRLKYKKNYAIVCRYRLHSDNMSAGNFIDRSFESRVMRGILQRYDLRKIYHWLNWDSPEAANAVALYMASQNLLQIGDIHNASQLLHQIPVHLQTADIYHLRLCCLLFQGHNKAAMELLDTMPGNAPVRADQLARLRANVHRYIQSLNIFRKALARRDHRTLQNRLQKMDSEKQMIPPMDLIAMGELQGLGVPQGTGLKMLQTAIMRDPANEALRRTALAMLKTDADRDRLEETRRRLLEPVDVLNSRSELISGCARDDKRNITVPVAANAPIRPSVTFILPHSGSRSDLTRLLGQLVPAPDISCEFVVLADPSAGTCRNHSFSIKVVNPAKNTITTEDYNTALALATGEWIVLMQQPLHLDRRWWTAVQTIQHQDDRFGILSPLASDVGGLLAPPPDLPPGSFLKRAGRVADRCRHRRLSRIAFTSPCFFMHRSLLSHLGNLDSLHTQPATAFLELSVRSSWNGYRNLILGDVLSEEWHGKSRVRLRKDHSGKHPDNIHEKATSIHHDIQAGLGKERVALLKALESLDRDFHHEDLQSAVTHFQEIVAGFPDLRTSLHAFMAERLLEHGQAHAVRDIFSDMLGMEPSVGCMALYGDALQQCGELGEARQWADRLLSRHPRNAAGLDLIGILSYRKGDRDHALECFRAALTSDPSHFNAHAHLATVLWESAKEAEALQHFRSAFVIRASAPKIAADYHAAATALMAFEEAIDQFREACRLYPENRKLHFLLIDLLLKSDQYVTAMALTETVIVKFGADAGLLEAARAIRVKLGSVTIMDGKAPSLSLCMIVKNEASHLARSLASLKPLVDEMIVVDTGSTDATRDIAEVFGARVFDFEWCDDFAAARNFSLDRASGDWILVMDADEVLSPADHKNIRKLLKQPKSGRHAFMVVTRNYTEQYNIVGWKPNRGQYPLEEKGTGWIPSEKVRLFPNDTAIRFEYPVHEVIGPALSRMGISIAACSCPVHHYGKLDQSKERQKDEFYYKIGMGKLSACRNDPVAIREMAVQAAKLGRHEDSLKLWQHLIELQPDNATCYINLASNHGQLKQYRQAREAARQAVRLSPELKEGHLNLGLSELHLGHFATAESIFHELTRGDGRYFSAVFLLGASQMCQGNLKKGAGTLNILRNESMWDNLSYAIQELVESLQAAGWREACCHLIKGSEALNCSNENLRACRRQLEAEAA